MIDLRRKSLTRILLLLLALGLVACQPQDAVAIVEEVLAPPSAQTPFTPRARPTDSARRPSSVTASLSPTPGKRVKNTPGDFDFFVLALSWSPDYCANNANDAQQCSLGKKLAFVLHGLWPQYTRGYPADCSIVKLPKDAQQKFPNLYPSSKLYTHEWDKHGTCSGLKPLEFLALSKSLKESIVIPTAYRSPAKAFRTTIDDLKTAFVAANSTLGEDALAAQCSGSGRFLKELYVCFSREGKPIACSKELQQDEAKSCGRADFLVRNVK